MDQGTKCANARSARMTKTWLIVNEASGSYDAAVIADIVTWFADSDQPVDCIVRCPDEDLPSPEKLRAEGVDTLTIYAGDGTTNGALKAAAQGRAPPIRCPIPPIARSSA